MSGIFPTNTETGIVPKNESGRMKVMNFLTTGLKMSAGNLETSRADMARTQMLSTLTCLIAKLERKKAKA